ncbi:MAG TPA: L-arabinonate dehydratase [Solirubrobacteraceae bacterium]|nr:L-arabinonate dehydratase [Solirubrobacteraceae bacterium]
MTRSPEQLRSHRWFGPDSLKAFGHRSRIKQMGYSAEDFHGRPVIAVLNTWSGIACCHTHFRERAEQVRNGVWAAGGFPLEIPVVSLAEQFQKPSAMMYRNLLAMETEEVLRSYPIDGAVLMGGCDKTTPALVMGAISADLPAILLPAGPMLRGNWRGQPVGSGTDVWKFWAEREAGQLDECAWRELEDGIARSPGHCMTMGTASTMTAAVDALGLTLPGASSIPAVDANHGRMAAACGRAIVELVWQDRRLGSVLTAESFDNAITTVLALGGSTNAVIHLIAMARRAGVDLGLDRFDELSRSTPVLADIRPGGRYLMEDFFYAGGLLAVLAELRELLHLDAARVTGETVGEACLGAEVFNREVIRPLDLPVSPTGALAILRGSLAPDGAVIKAVAADPGLLRHRGPAVTFEDQADLEARINDPDLSVTPDSVLVLKRAGPVGAPGMPEWGMLPIPRRLLEAGVRDMVRISDARMSGTSYGTCVLHVAPESAVGGPLAFVRDGDEIELDVPGRRLDLLVSDEELAGRRAGFTFAFPRGLSGYGELFTQHVTQANLGCDFDFLERRVEVSEPVIH